MISVEEMRNIENKANEIGIEDYILMENAGSNSARIINDKIKLNKKKVVVFCGTGNNGGDGLVLARHALILGAEVGICFVKNPEFLKPLPKKNYSALKNIKSLGSSVEIYKKLTKQIRADVLVDAMLGIGIKGEVSEEYMKAIETFNSLEGLKVSLDCPSGIDADTGKELGISVRPDITITFYDKKKGLNKKNSGCIIVADIGIPKI